MKAISIKYPWLGLILDGTKRIELRTWKNKYRGVILLHASTGYDTKAPAKYKKKYPRGKHQVGGIVGRATIIECQEYSQKRLKQTKKQHLVPKETYETKPKVFGFLLNDAKHCDFIKVKGHNRIWDVEVDQFIEQEVENLKGKLVYCGKGCQVQTQTGTVMPLAAYCPVANRFACGTCQHLISADMEVPQAWITEGKELTKKKSRKKK